VHRSSSSPATRTWLLLLPLALVLPACADEEPIAQRPSLGQPGPRDLGGGSGDEDLAGPADPDLGGEPGADQGADLGPGPQDLGDEPQPDLDLPALPVEVDTVLAAEDIAAGSELRVRCVVLDERGQEIEGELTSFVVHPDLGWDSEPGSSTITPWAVGSYQVACQAPRAGLIDRSPALLRVHPGPVVAVLTELERDAVVAGEQTLARCQAFDAFGNEVDGQDYELSTDPQGDGIDWIATGQPAVEYLISTSRSGFYRIACQVEGAQELWAASLRVDAGLPAQLVVGLVPRRALYRIGEVVWLAAEVYDNQGNLVPGAQVDRDVSPELPGFGAERYRFDRDGRFQLSARVLGDTEGGQPLSAAVTAEVSSEGPAVGCLSPVDGGVVQLTPGRTLTLRGSVADANGVASVEVAGRAVQVDARGQFSAEIATEFGLNVVELVAEDAHGMRSSSFCSFLVADRFHPMQDFLPDAVTLRLAQSAVDDGTPNTPLTSLADILRRMLGSAGLVSTVNSMMVQQNPLYNDCAVDCALFCCVHATVTYTNGSFALPGPNDLSMTLVDGGLRISTTLRNPRLSFYVDNTVADVEGTVGTEYITVTMTFDASLDGNGRPSVRLRPNSESVSVGDLVYDGQWWNEWLVEIVLWLFGGYFENQIAGTLQGYLRDNVDAILDGVLGNLDISALGAQFDVPSLTGGAPATLSVGVNFSRLNFNPARALFGMGMRLSGPIRHPGDPAGAPIPPGGTSLDPGGQRSMAAAVSYGVLNQALYALWRAGFLDFDIAGFIPGLEAAPEGTELALAVDLPPVARQGDAPGRLSIGLGGVSMRLAYPNLFDRPIELRLAAEASAGARLINQGRDLEFDAVTVDRLYFTTPTVTLTPEVRGLLEDLLTEILQSVIDDMINGALPVLPIPQFELPAMLAPYGIPQGSILRLTAPSLSTTAGHFVVQGNMGQ